MAPPDALINPLPLLGGISSTVQLSALGVLGLGLLAGAALLARRWRRRTAIAELGRQRGLGEQSSAFLGGLFAGEGLDAAETMLAAPELLRARLARELRRRHRDESAQAYAVRAAHLLEELNSIPPAFPGAPSPFLQLALQDAADPKSEVVTAWVLSVDERNISIISRHECDWPMRRELLATPAAGQGEPFRASLLLRPVPPRHEWVLTHDLVDVITNRRASVRVSCCLHTDVLPDNGDAVLLRERLAEQETLPADDLRRLHAWAQRHGATVLDVSSDGCRVELEHEVAVRDRFHVVFITPDDRVAGMPLAEVVSLQQPRGGRVTAGVRFIGMRLKERTRLAEFVRELAASQGVPAGAARGETPQPAAAVAEPHPPEPHDATLPATEADPMDALGPASATDETDEIAAAGATGDDDALDSSDDERRRARERLGLLPPGRPGREPANAHEGDPLFADAPRFTSPSALPAGRDRTPPPEPELPPPSLEAVDFEREADEDLGPDLGPDRDPAA